MVSNGRNINCLGGLLFSGGVLVRERSLACFKTIAPEETSSKIFIGFPYWGPSGGHAIQIFIDALLHP